MNKCVRCESEFETYTEILPCIHCDGDGECYELDPVYDEEELVECFVCNGTGEENYVENKYCRICSEEIEMGED
jgi:hypothetical protein